MTITVPLTPEEEAKLAALAERQGVTSDTFLQRVVKDLIQAASPISAGVDTAQGREQQIEEFFHSFDTLSGNPGIAEDAFHREHWYR